MAHAIGIDLGTTHSVIAYVNSAAKPEIIPNREGMSLTPSAVLLHDGPPLVGPMAKRSAAATPENVAQYVKRRLGDPAWRFVTSAGEAYTAEEVSALILKRLAQDAELALGEGAVTGVVITVPAQFGDARRRATMDAARIAGLDVLGLVNEPTAAALAHHADTGAEGTLLVVDLGGGTFDVSVMKVASGTCEVIATGGDNALGGLDWDHRLMERINDEFTAEGGDDLFGDYAAANILRERAQLAKRSLTSVPRATVVVTHNDYSTALSISRKTFEDASAGLLGRMRRTIEDVVASGAGAEWGDIDHVLLVGGAARMPMVQGMVQGLTGKEPERSGNPEEIVALGAALRAGALLGEAAGPPATRPLVVRDVTSRGLGVLSTADGRAVVNTSLIRRNDPVPAAGSFELTTRVDSQSDLSVEITEGEETDPDLVTKVGRQEIAIPRYPRGASFRVVCSYDADQIIHVEVIDSATGRPVAGFEADNVANLSRDFVKHSAARVARTAVG